MGRVVVVPRPGSTRTVNIWKPSQMESIQPTPVERLLNRQRDAATISPGGGERTPVEQLGTAVLLLLPIPNAPHRTAKENQAAVQPSYFTWQYVHFSNRAHSCQCHELQLAFNQRQREGQ